MLCIGDDDGVGDGVAGVSQLKHHNSASQLSPFLYPSFPNTQPPSLNHFKNNLGIHTFVKNTTQDRMILQEKGINHPALSPSQLFGVYPRPKRTGPTDFRPSARAAEPFRGFLRLTLSVDSHMVPSPYVRRRVERRHWTAPSVVLTPIVIFQVACVITKFVSIRDGDGFGDENDDDIMPPESRLHQYLYLRYLMTDPTKSNQPSFAHDSFLPSPSISWRFSHQ